MAAGVQLADLSKFTDAYGTNKNFKKRDKIAKLNPWADAGSLSQDPYFDPDKTTGSYAWKGLLNDENPDALGEFYTESRSFITPDKKGFKQSDDAYKKWEGFAFNDFEPGNKSGPLADRVDTGDIQSFYDTYYASRLVDDETFVGSSNLRYMFEEPSAIASTESNPNEVNVSPSKGIEV